MVIFINAWLSKCAFPKWGSPIETTFNEENYVARDQKTTGIWSYDLVWALVETSTYIMFVLDKRRFQAFDKTSLTGGTLEEFRTFIEEKTQKKVRLI